MKHLRNKTNKINKKNVKHKTHKQFKNLNCSPKQPYDFTCYSKESLNKLKTLWNARHPDAKILTNNSKNIWISLKNYMNDICSNEKCWLNQEFMKNYSNKTLKKYTFAPEAPNSWKKNPNTWLTSIDIDQVMQQYEHKFPNFVFLGPSPIDFDKRKLFGQCVWNELCNFDLKNYKKNKKNKIGIVFNTDPHYLAGSHWICMFIDIKNKFIYYFDSNADKIPKEVNKFAKRVIKQGNTLGINFKFIKNKIEHQKTNTECGIFVLYVILQLLQEKMTPESFNTRISDKNMELLRKIYFN